MKVKSIKLLTCDLKEVEDSPWLTKGKEYIVLGLSIAEDETELYLETDGGQPAYFNIKGFEVLSNYIPSSWVIIFYKNSNDVSFYPKSWKNAKSFWEDFTDGDLKMTELYEKERDLIYAEEPK